VSLYHEFAAGDRATELLVQMARDKAKAEAETRRNAGQAAAELPDMEAEAADMTRDYATWLAAERQKAEALLAEHTQTRHGARAGGWLR